VGVDFAEDGFFELSPLLAHTSTTDRCKSFISTHIAKQGGVGGTTKVNFGFLGREAGRAKCFRLLWLLDVVFEKVHYNACWRQF
jgi:hypothetical protein